MQYEYSPMQLTEITDFSFLKEWDTIRIVPEGYNVEAAMANQPTKFIAYSQEHIAEALRAYGYTASAEVVRSRGFDRGY